MANKIKNYTNPDHEGIINSANAIIKEAVIVVINEALNHFSMTRRPRTKTDDDNRYLYNEEEVEAFFSRYNRNDVRCNIIKDEFGGVFCYELTRLPVEIYGR